MIQILIEIFYHPAMLILLFTVFSGVCSAQIIRITPNSSQMQVLQALVNTKLSKSDTLNPTATIMTRHVADSTGSAISDTVSKRVRYTDSLTKYVTPKQIGDSAFLKRVALTSALIATTLGYTPANASAIPDTTSLSNRINLKLNKADTSTLSARINENAVSITTNTANIATNTSNIGSNSTNIATNTSNISTNTTNIALKLNKTDTAGMLAPYLRTNIAASSYYPLSGNPSNFLTSIAAQSFASLTGKPTTLSGYGITDAYPLSGNPSSFLVAADISGKKNITDSGRGITQYATGGGLKKVTDSLGTIIGTKISSNQSIVVTATGDATGTSSSSGTAPSLPLTLATVNSNVGTFNASYTANAKGLITAATNASFNSSPARLLSTTGSNNTFTISASKNARAFYTINFAFALTLTTSNGYVELDYSIDGGSNWITCGSVSSVYSVSVTLTGNTDAELSGEIPAGALVRLYRINATNVTITAPTTKQLEVTY